MSSRIYGQGTHIALSPKLYFRGRTTLVLQDGSRLSRDQFGVDTLVRQWKCRRDLTLSNLPGFGDRDFQYPQLEVYDFSVATQDQIDTIAVSYNGFLTKGRPTVRRRYNLQERRESFQIVDVGQIEVAYLAPTLTLNYALPERPKFRNAYEYNGDFEEKVKIVAFRIGGETLGEQESAIAAALVKKAITTETVRTNLDQAEEGRVWRISETIERRLMQRTALAQFE